VKQVIAGAADQRVITVDVNKNKLIIAVATIKKGSSGA
jgi:hypothetical protein